MGFFLFLLPLLSKRFVLKGENPSLAVKHQKNRNCDLNELICYQLFLITINHYIQYFPCSIN